MATLTITATPSSVFMVAGYPIPTSTIKVTPGRGGGIITVRKTDGPNWAVFSNNTITFMPESISEDDNCTVEITATEELLKTQIDYDNMGDVKIEYNSGNMISHNQYFYTTTQSKEIAVCYIECQVYDVKECVLQANKNSVVVIAGGTDQSIRLNAIPGNEGTIEYVKVSGPYWVSLDGNRVLFTPDLSVSAGNYPTVFRAIETFILSDGISRITKSVDIIIECEVESAIIIVEPPEPDDSETK